MLRSDWQSYLDLRTDQRPAPEGVSYLPQLGVVRFRGPDALAFLQGYLTCDTIDMSPDALTPMAVCNLKGRVVVNGWCYRPDPGGESAAASESVVLFIHVSLVERVAQFFKAYLMFSKTEFADLSDAILVFGTSATPAANLAIDADHGLIVVNEMAEAREVYERQPQRPAGDWWLEMIRAAVPLISAATSEAFLPQMLDLERLGAIDFAKGCYLGQEVVARAQHRGEVKRRLQRLSWAGPTPPEPGAQFGAPSGGQTGGQAGETANRTRHLGTVINSAASIDGDPTGECLAVVANDASGPFQLHDTVLNRVG